MPFDLLVEEVEGHAVMAPGTKLNSHSHESHHWEMPPRKRARAGTAESTEDDEIASPSPKHRKYHEPLLEKNNHTKAIPAAKLDPEVTAPFMTKHVPTQYNPQGNPADTTDEQASDPNTKFCYRHRPDMLCRRQADEPTMDKLQKNLEKLPESDRQAVVQVWSLFSAAPSKHRNLMLQGILTQCCFPQLSFMSANVQKLIKIDFLSALPPEISFRILSSLDTISLCKAAQVSRKWRQLADDDVVWHRMCEQHIDRKCTKCGWGLPLLDRKRLRASKRQMQLRAAGKGLNVWSPASTPVIEVEQNPLARELVTSRPALAVSPTAYTSARQVSLEPAARDSNKPKRPWKHVYRDRFRVGKNWKHGVCSTKVLKGHDNGIMAVQLLDNILATGSYDKTIKIWNLDTGKEIRTLTGHTGGIRCLQFDDSKLISGSMDGTMKLWNWRTGACLATYTGHTDYVIGLHFDSDILVSGSADHTAKVWNFQDKSVFTLRGHDDWVNSVRIDSESRTVFTASDDFTVKLWDLDTKQCIHTYKGHGAHVQQVLLLPREFDMEEDMALLGDQVSEAGSQTADSASFSGHDQSPVMSHNDTYHDDERAGAYRSTFENGRPEPPRYMLTSALDNTIRMWDVSTGREIRKFFGHVEGVWALAADSLRIVSGANDRMVKIWDPRTGKCERTFTGHTGPVTCIGLSDSRMCSAGEDNDVRVYCFSEKDCF